MHKHIRHITFKRACQRHCIILFFSLLSTCSIAQSHFETWFDVTAGTTIGKNSFIGGDFGVRGFISVENWNQFYIRPTYRYILNGNVNFAGGVGLFHTSNRNKENLTELRLFQEANAHWPSTALLEFGHRVRLEERFFRYEDGQNTPASEVFFFRWRYQLSVLSRDFDIMKQKIYFQTAAEIFNGFSDGDVRFVNNARFVFALGHRLNKAMRYEVHYIYQVTKGLEDLKFETSAHILRVRFFFIKRRNKKE